jgi:hypothetical protein
MPPDFRRRITVPGRTERPFQKPNQFADMDRETKALSSNPTTALKNP